MNRIFIIWHDYDGTYIEPFNCESREKVEERCTEIMAKADYGVQIDTVIEGKELTIKSVEVVSKVLLI